MTSTTLYGLILGVLAASGCGNVENTSSPSPSLPECDATPDEACTCSPDGFIACVGETAVSCNEKGDGITTQSCGEAGCNAEAGRCNTCVASKDSCSSDLTTLEHCGADGLIAQQELCAAGCFSDLFSTHCMNIKPAWLTDACDKPATIPSASFTNTLDTDQDASCTGGVVTKNGSTFCVLRAGTIDIGTLKVTGTRPIAIIADDLLKVTGTLDVSADGSTSGPGASTLGRGTPSIGASYLGAGGAGFAQTGGTGGANDNGSAAGAAGGAMQQRRTDSVFGGGAQGGDSRCDNGTTYCFNGVDFAGGGGGGGALLIACRGTVKVTGMVDAGGGGGRGGGDHFSSTSVAPGGAPGGGSGGYVVFQGARVEISGKLYANGGGGGAGCTGDNCVGPVGSDGLRSTSGAPGGDTPTATCGGGIGGSVSSVPGTGEQTYANGAAGAGGGGGSMGRFEVFTPAGGTASLAPTEASPMPVTNTTPLALH